LQFPFDLLDYNRQRRASYDNYPFAATCADHWIGSAKAVDCRLRFLLFQFIIFITHSLQLERIAQVLSKSLRGAQMRLDYRAASPADLNRKKQDWCDFSRRDIRAIRSIIDNFQGSPLLRLLKVDSYPFIRAFVDTKTILSRV
jgi:hypothetical protein